VKLLNTPVKVLSGEQDPCDPNSFLKDIVAVSAGDCHSMALDKNGNVWTWGDNEYGQLGIHSADPCRLTPVCPYLAFS
jgi:alpha-tubulin suppressor-like RCC1 family protein